MKDSINNEGTSNLHLPNLVTEINKKLDELPATKELSNEFFMSKVHEGLRSTVVKHEGRRSTVVKHEPYEAYEPMLVSIGPYHYGKPELRAMEKHKLRYLRKFLQRTKEHVDTYISALEKIESEARKHYVNLPTCLETRDKFIEMMLLDGCFIIVLFYRIIDAESIIDPDDYFIRVPWMRARICLDLILLENQLPCFVLTELFKSESDFKNLAIEVFNKMLPKPQPDFQYGGGNGTEKIKHLLHLVHISFCPTSNEAKSNPAGAESNSPSPSHQESDLEQPLMSSVDCKELISGQMRNCKDWILDKMRSVVKLHCNDGNKNKDEKDWTRLHTMRRVVKLQEAGVKFQKAGGNDKSKKEGNNDNSSSGSTTSTLFDMNFNKGLLEIPCFRVEDFTETLFRNLVAYEQHTVPLLDHRYVSDFVAVMDKLIDTEADAKVLCDKRIIENFLADNKAVSQLFNKLSDGLIVTFDSFYYSDLCLKLNKHCAIRWNTMKATFWGDYFYTPWASASTIAAILLLILAITQTAASIKDLVK